MILAGLLFLITTTPQVKARSLFPQLLLNFMRVLPLETTHMNREPLLQSQCAAMVRELDPASSPRVDSASALVQRLTELFGQAKLFVQAVKMLLGDRIDSSENDEGDLVAFALQELHEARQINRRISSSEVHAPDSFDLAEEDMLTELERTLFATQVSAYSCKPCRRCVYEPVQLSLLQPIHISLIRAANPVDTLLDAPLYSHTDRTTRVCAGGKLNQANTGTTTTTVEILNDVSTSMRARLLDNVVEMFRTICTKQTEHLKKLFPRPNASPSFRTAHSGRQSNAARCQNVTITLSHIVLALQIIVQLVPSGHDSPASPGWNKQLLALSALKDKLLQLLYTYLPHLANKETAKDESGIFLLMSVLRFHAEDILIEVSS